jgi:CheY-like chemotaxis protein
MLAGQNQLILLVEDDALVRVFARGQLECLGYRVLEAATGAAALELLRGRDDVALLFTDVVMPGGMSGRQLADAATQLRPALPILYTSGYTEDAIIHHGRLAPGVMLLSKPYRRAELAQKVSAALGAAVGATHQETQ